MNGPNGIKTNYMNRRTVNKRKETFLLCVCCRNKNPGIKSENAYSLPFE